MKIFAIILLALISLSCSIYKSEWDCPPGEGVRCKPVSEVLDMIVERDDGTDLFVKNRGQAALLREMNPKKRKPVLIHPDVEIREENKTLYLLKKPAGDAVIVEAKS